MTNITSYTHPYLSPVLGDCWVSEDETVEIREGSVVRLRIIGLVIDAGVIRYNYSRD